MLTINSISFIWPAMLWFLLLIPLLMSVYVLLLFRQQNTFMRSTSGQDALRHSSIWIRHAPALLFLFGLIFIVTSLARPRAVLALPTSMKSIMLAVDTSSSMGANDIAPSRIEVAQSAIKQFIAAQPSQVSIGIVTIAGAAALAQAPTTNRNELNKIVSRLPLQTGSALGSGILIALTELVPGTGIAVQKILDEASQSSPPTDSGRPLNTTRRPLAAASVAPGSNQTFSIVLLSDGQSNFGPDPIKMAQLAADAGVRIHTVGLGTPEGVTLKAQGVLMRVKLDEITLRKISDLTLGDYYQASNLRDLKKIYQSLTSTIRIQQHQVTEVTALSLGLGMLLISIATCWSLGRYGRML